MKPFVAKDFRFELEDFITVRISTGGSETCVNWNEFRDEMGKFIQAELLEETDKDWLEGKDADEILDILGVPSGYECSTDDEFPYAHY